VGAVNAGRAAIARVTKQVAILHLYYKADPNPLLAWEAVRLFTKLPGAPAPLPKWVSNYLHDAANTLIDLAEGIDRSARKLPPMPKGNAQAAIKAFTAAYGEFEGKPSVIDKYVGERALHALGLRSTRGKNVFTNYRKMLHYQYEVELAAIEEAQREVAKKQGRHTYPVVSSSAEKRLRLARKRLKEFGRLEPKNKFGPEPTRRQNEIFGRK
jgi:hypothetical protein